MNLLVVGNGGREHALVWKLAQSDKVKKIFVAPGNGGTATALKSRNIPIKADDIAGLLAFAQSNSIDFTVVGPEIPLSMGIVDLFMANGLKIFGPCKDAAHMESSKAFAKEIMIAANVPTADYGEFTSYSEAAEYVKSKGVPIVVKADGLAAGKGVTVAQTVDEALQALDDVLNKKIFGDTSVVVEEFLTGEELSYLVVTDGETIVPMVSSQDHKAVLDGDKGANTGGMGAYSPTPLLTGEKYDSLSDLVSKPIIDELKKRNIHFKGVLYAGLMISADGGIKVLEYNTRFGDPETQVIMPRMKSDLLEMLLAAADGVLSEYTVQWDNRPSATVVMASGGYPGDYLKGDVIAGIYEADKLPHVTVFHAGTTVNNGQIKTNGGRVLNVTAMGDTLHQALDNAYKGVAKISFKDMHFRKDIGQKALKRMG